ILPRYRQTCLVRPTSISYRQCKSSRTL
ncbi:uncharacterized protein METZ01_LOCUS211965, partial [marine metagenome]